MSAENQQQEPSEELKRLLDRPFTFDLLRDPTWTPSREDYRSIRDALAARLAAAEEERDDLLRANSDLTIRLGRAIQGLSPAAHRVYLNVLASPDAAAEEGT